MFPVIDEFERYLSMIHEPTIRLLWVEESFNFSANPGAQAE